MGNAGGHVVPGVFFLIYGCAWCLFSFWIHLTSQSKSNNHLRIKSKPKQTRSQSSSSRASSSPSCENFKSEFNLNRDIELSGKSYIPQPFCRSIPVEPIIKVICALLGILVEAFFVMKDGKIVFQVVPFVQLPDHDGHLNHGHFTNIAKLQHITMYLGFLVSGMVDILTLFLSVPRATSKLFLTLAFVTEGMLFYFHQDSTGEVLLYNVHMLLLISIIICGLFSALRIKTPVNLLINSGLAFGILLQGTWFIQVGMIYHQKDQWNFSDHSNAMFVVALFAWHITIIWSVMLLTFIILTACFKILIYYRAKDHRQWLPPIPLLPMTATAHDSEEGQQLIQPEPAPSQVIETATL